MPMRWGVVGCGDIVRKRVGRAIQDHAASRLIAACRRDVPTLRAFCELFEVPRAYSSAGELLADPDVDAVYIATPVHLHCPQTLAAAAAGKHVLVEKPMALSTEQCRQMIDACQAAGVRLGVAYYRRFYPVVQRMRAILQSGDLGRILAVGAVTATRFAIAPGEDGYWRVIPEQGGGGSLMDVGSHRIDLMLNLFGDAQIVKSVCGTVAATYESEDCASVLMELNDRVQATLACYFGAATDPDEFTIQGIKGRLVAAPLNGGTLTVTTANGQLTESHATPDNLHGPLIDDFVRAIEEGRDPTVTGTDGLRVNDVIERAYLSATSG